MTRWQPRFNVVYTAERSLFVTVQYTGGWSGTVSLLVGPGDPPGTLLGELSPVTNSFVGGLVQAGEQWTLASKKEPRRGGVICWATPLDQISASPLVQSFH